MATVDARPLRLLVYDSTAVGLGINRRSLGRIWAAGSLGYRALGRIDASLGTGDWRQALEWLASVCPGRLISEIQIWAHGHWGRVLLGNRPLGRELLRPEHPLSSSVTMLRQRLLPDGGSLFWLRTCESFGAQAGHDLAMALADGLGCRVAGHTYTIGFWQSGLHSLEPGRRPDWPVTEGLAQGTPLCPERSLASRRTLPHTITCLQGKIPAGW